MSWKIENSTKRIYNVFKRSKSQIYKEDVEALETVLNAIKEGKKDIATDNVLFLKLLSIHLLQNLDYYGNIKNAVKESGKLLNQPLTHHIEKLRTALNYAEASSYLNSIKEEDYNNPDVVEKINKSWSYSTVESSLYNSCNDFIKDIDNYK